MESSTTVKTVDRLVALLDQARAFLSHVETEMNDLLDQAGETVNAVTQEQMELQRFLQEFSLELTIYHLLPEPEDDTGPVFDIDALRAGAHELSTHVNRAVALRANFSNVVQMLQMCQNQIASDDAFRLVQESSDVRLQLAMNSAREDERKRLAREIHDGPAQVMANAIYAIQITEQVARRAPDQVIEELSRVRELLKDGVSEIRRFMFDLRPTMLQDHGLAPTLRRYVEDYNRFFAKRIQLRVSDPLPPISAEQELTIFRIVQEALQNIHKHAGFDATASIELISSHGALTLSIKDSGRGFEPTGIVSRPGTGAGLPGMRERAKLAGGDFLVTSSPGAGTTVQLRMRVRSEAPPVETSKAS